MNNAKDVSAQLFRIALLMLVLSGMSVPCYAAQDPIELADTYVPKLKTMLMDNIASFWLTKAPDYQNGGYTINIGAQGDVKAGGSKMIVTQARTVWLFSRLVRAGYGGEDYLVAAEHGYRFLKEKMWDPEHGGFFWEVDVTGNQALRPRKHLYGQSFALYALSEYYLACQEPEVLDFAVQFFKLLETKAHDPEFGGYLEFFDADWSSLPATTASYMSVPADLKLMNTHLHLLEALTTFYRASQLPEARERLLELILIESNTVVKKDLGACTDKYMRDWRRRLDQDYARVSYGHDIENIWLLMDACDAMGLSNWPLLELYKTLFNYSYEYGYDLVNGGFYDSGLFDQAADRRSKIWWVQAEALVSALYMYRMTKDPRHLSVFETTYAFVDKHMADWEHGEWWGSVTSEGTGQGENKAHAWKCGYHNGRALIECIAVLQDLKATREKERDEQRGRDR
jgi:mannobiose 2-epimerase